MTMTPRDTKVAWSRSSTEKMRDGWIPEGLHAAPMALAVGWAAWVMRQRERSVTLTGFVTWHLREEFALCHRENFAGGVGLV